MTSAKSKKRYCTRKYFTGTINPVVGTNVALYSCPPNKYAKVVLCVVDGDDTRYNSYHVLRGTIKNNLIWSGNRGLVPGEFEIREGFLQPTEEVRFIYESPGGGTSNNQPSTYRLRVYEYELDI